MHLNAQQLDFLARLGKSPDGQLLQTLLKAEIDDTNELLRSSTGEVLYRAQGRATYLVELAKRLASPTFVPQTRPRQVIPSDSR